MRAHSDRQGAQATVLLVVTAFMIWLKARKMQRHPRLMDPELAAIMRNGKGRVFNHGGPGHGSAVCSAVWGATGRGARQCVALLWPGHAQGGSGATHVLHRM